MGRDIRICRKMKYRTLNAFLNDGNCYRLAGKMRAAHPCAALMARLVTGARVVRCAVVDGGDGFLGVQYVVGQET